MRSPIPWYGGKHLLAKRIIPFIECAPHQTYVEPFGGGANVLLTKRPSNVEVYNDRDEGLVNFFRVLADPMLFDQFCRRVSALPYSRALHGQYGQSWMNETDPVVRAAQWFLVARQSFSGQFNTSWGYSVSKSCRGMASECASWLSAIQSLPNVHARLMRVQIECHDWRTVLEAYDRENTLFYMDPPYVWETRRPSSQNIYAHELSNADDRDLTAAILKMKGRGLLSGYESAVYAPLLDAGWSVTRWRVPCYAVAKTKLSGLQGTGCCERNNQMRTECLYVSPGVQADQLLFE